jgi:lysophospholipase L1-like esterase
MNVTLWAYLAQLIIPLFLLLDLAWSWHDGYFAVSNHGRLGATTKIVAAVSVAWLVGGAGALLFARNRQAFLKRMSSPLLSFYVVAISVVAGDWMMQPKTADRRTFIRLPGSTETLVADPRVTPGCAGRKLLSVNEVGLRGGALPQENNVFKIMTAGGSTTECRFLDDSEEWPHLLMTGLNSRQKKAPVWVANAGYAGHTAVHTLALLESVAVFKKAQMIVLLMGINDLQSTLEMQGASTEKALQRSARQFLDGQPAEHQPLHVKSQIYQRVHQLAYRRDATSAVSMEPGWWYGPMRANRKTSPELPLPDLQTGLNEFRGRIGRLGALCHERGWRCLFVTQPTMWRPDLSQPEKELLWFGWLGPMYSPRGHVSISDLAIAISRYNSALIEQCHRDGLEVYDLAPLVPKNTSAFLDDCHFNENGAKIVGERLVEYLTHTPIIGPGG